jgi:DNA-binding LacI/PurR family transcriptional regulator
MIAKECGVSNATVSRVLRGDHAHGFSVRPEVRDRILKTVQLLNYRPNLTAQSLRAQQTHLVAVLGLTPPVQSSSDVNSAALGAAANVLHELGYSVCTSFPKPNRPDGQLPTWCVDGYLLVGVQDDQSLSEIEASGIPYVGINTRVGPTGYACQVDDTKGVQIAMDYLQSMGHRRIAYRNGSAERSRPDSHAIMDRHSAFVDEVKTRSLPLLDHHDTMIMPDHEFIAQCVKQQATCILAYDLAEAIRLMQAAYQANVKIPQQLSMICFNDEYPAALLTPPLTVMGVPARSMGRQAAVMLVDLLQGTEVSPRIRIFEEQLITRQSVVRV